MNRTVAIMGVLDDPTSTNVWMAEAFRKLKFEIIPINYRNILQEKGREYLFNYTKFILENNKPELLIFCKISGVAPDVVEMASSKTNTWYWFMDNISVAQAMRAEEYAKRCKFVSATSSEVISDLFIKHVKHDNIYQIIEGFSQKIFYPEEIKKETEVLFFGNATSKRVTYLKELKDKGINIKVFGSGYPEFLEANEPVYLHDLRKEINKAKIVLNLVHSNIFSDRVVTAMACKTFILSEHCNDLSVFFDIGKHLDTFETLSDCADKIQKYLDDVSLRKQISEEAFSKVNRMYTWEEVVKRILDCVERTRS